MLNQHPLNRNTWLETGAALLRSPQGEILCAAICGPAMGISMGIVLISLVEPTNIYTTTAAAATMLCSYHLSRPLRLAFDDIVQSLDDVMTRMIRNA